MIIKKKNFANSKFIKFISKIFWGIIFILTIGLEGWLISSLISPFFQKLDVSQSFTLLRKPDDWVLLIITNISMLTGIYLIRLMIKHKQETELTKNKYHFWPLFFGMFGCMLTSSSFLGLLAEATYMKSDKITAKFIKSVAMITNVNYVVGYLTMIVTICLMLWLVRNWIKQNYWYAVAVIVPPLIYIRQLLILQINWQKFLNAKSTTYEMLAKMFTAAHDSGNISIDVALMNGAVEPALITSWIGLFILIMIGGLILVIKIKTKTQQRIREKIKK
ncbi:hypothetical protein ACWCL1_08240 [Ligilactobacillus sp. LYQ135]